MDIDDTTSNAIIVRDPLIPCLQTLGYAPPSEDRRKRYEPRNFQDFWFMLQDIIENEYNVELCKINDKILQYQEASALQMQYLQQAIMHMSLNVMALKAELENPVKTNAIARVEDRSEPMDWEWTSPAPIKPKNLVTDFDIEATEGVWTPKAAEQVASEKAREQRAGSFPPSTPQVTLGASLSTRRKRNNVNKDLQAELGGSGGERPPKKPKGEKTAGGGGPGGSTHNSDSDPSDNKGELPKVKIALENLLAKHISAMIKDQRHQDKADIPKPQTYKGDLEDLERFLGQLENV